MNDSQKSWKDKFLYFLIGGLSSLVIVLLLGAASDPPGALMNFGRYQISSWATRVDDNSAVVGAFVLDTVVGEARTVYVRTYGAVPETKVLVNELNKTYSQMKQP